MSADINRLLLPLAVALLAVSCTQKVPKKQVSEPTGFPGEIAVFCPAAKNDTAFYSLLDSLFASPSRLVYPAEPTYRYQAAADITQQPEAFLLNHRLKLVICTREQSAAVAKWLQLSSLPVKGADWMPQMSDGTVWLCGVSTDNLKQNLSDPGYRKQLLTQLKHYELSQPLPQPYTPDHHADSVARLLKDKYGFGFPVPSVFKKIHETGDFCWYSYEGGSFIANLYIHVQPDTGLNNMGQQQLIRRRDQACRMYFPGQTPGTYMSTSTSGLFSTEFEMFPCSSVAYILRGSWTVKGEVNNGPFVRYNFSDQKTGRHISVEGFVQGEGNNRLALLRLLETFIRRGCTDQKPSA